MMSIVQNDTLEVISKLFTIENSLVVEKSSKIVNVDIVSMFQNRLFDCIVFNFIVEHSLEGKSVLVGDTLGGEIKWNFG